MPACVTSCQAELERGDLGSSPQEAVLSGGPQGENAIFSCGGQIPESSQVTRPEQSTH